MSGSLSSSGISFSGLGSGIDTESIITRLMELEQTPIKRLQSRQAELINRMSLMNQFKGKMVSLSTAAAGLRQTSAFENYAATSSNSDVAEVRVGPGATTGSFSLAVSHLAQAHKIASSAQASATSALGLSDGVIVINGRGVRVEASDSLSSLAGKINQADAGVVATVIDGGSGNAYLSLTATSSGAASRIQISDLTGNAAAALGFISGAATVREPLTGGFASAGFASATDNLSSMLGTSGVGVRQIVLNGTSIDLDFDTMSLQAVAASINASGAGVTATIRSVTVSGRTVQKLELTGVASHSDPSGALEALGFLQRGFGNQILAAQDAQFTIDGVALSSPTNEVSGVVSGLTLQLKQADQSNPKTTNVQVRADNAATKAKIKDFVQAYNDLIDFIRSNSKFDAETYQAGPLLGDPTALQVESQLSEALFQNVPGLLGPYSNLTQVGVRIDTDGKISLDEAALHSALATNASNVAGLFAAVGRTSTSQLAFVSSTSATKPSGASGYLVEITQAATRASLVAATAMTAPSSAQETLTFGGALFGNGSVALVLESGISLSEIVARINADARLKDLVVASIDGGRLKIESKRYGTPGSFSVTSDRVAGPTSSGIGTAGATAPVAPTSPLAQEETLTFDGAAFAGTPHSLVLSAGMTLAEVAAAINADATLSTVLSASIDGGRLRFTPKVQGPSGAFTVSSDLAAGPATSGVGDAEITVGPIAVATAGLDVAGRINGEDAVGTGQFLTGAPSAPNVSGLQVMYTGATTGSIGTVTFTKGIGALLNDLVSVFTDGSNGSFKASNDALQEQSDAIEEQIADLRAQISLKEQALRKRFAQMESAIAALTAQQTRLASLISNLPKASAG
ncbi:MAG: flagellar filament capping protein FliD [Fimbriimonadales bacterium]|nr:flagellar filament capping protein FliD [Fimbriimonadales bacterium]